MTQQFIVTTNSAGQNVKDAPASARDVLTGFLEGKGWHVWHWFEDVWLVKAELPEPVNLIALHKEFRELSGRTMQIIFLPVDGSRLAGTIPTSSVPWLKTHFGTMTKRTEDIGSK